MLTSLKACELEGDESHSEIAKDADEFTKDLIKVLSIIE